MLSFISKNRSLFFLLFLIIGTFFVVRPVGAYYNFQTNCEEEKGSAGEGKKWAHFVIASNRVGQERIFSGYFDSFGDPSEAFVGRSEYCVKVSNSGDEIFFESFLEAEIFTGEVMEIDIKYNYFDLLDKEIKEFSDSTLIRDFKCLPKRGVRLTENSISKRLFYEWRQIYEDNPIKRYLFFIGFEGENLQEIQTKQIESYDCCLATGYLKDEGSFKKLAEIIGKAGGSVGGGWLGGAVIGGPALIILGPFGAPIAIGAIIYGASKGSDGLSEWAVEYVDSKGGESFSCDFMESGQKCEPDSTIEVIRNYTAKKVKCVSNSFCISEIPTHNDEAVTFTGSDDTILKLGETPEVNVGTQAKAGETITKIICPSNVCSNSSGLSMTSNGSNATIKFNSNQFYQANKQSFKDINEAVDFKGVSIAAITSGGQISMWPFAFRMNPYNCDQYEGQGEAACKANKQCLFFKSTCYSKFDTKICNMNLTKELCGTKEGATNCTWNKQLNKCMSPDKMARYSQYAGSGDGGGMLPPCAASGDCTDLNDIMILALKWSNRVFGFIGAAAFVMFVYGGFLMVVSFGNTERVKKGTDIMIAAVIGMLIVFGAFVLVNYILDALNVGTSFRAIRAF